MNSYTLYDLILRVAKAAAVAYYGSDGQGSAIVPIDQSAFEDCLTCVNDGIKFFIASAPPNGWRWMNRIGSVTFAPAVEGVAESGLATALFDSDLAGDYADNYFNGCTLKITEGTGKGETAIVTDYTKTTGRFDFSGGLSGGSTPDSTSQYRICRSTQVIDADPARYQLDEDFQGEITGPVHYQADSNRGNIISWVSEAEVRKFRALSVANGYPTKAAVRPYTNRRWELIVDPSPNAADTIEFPYRVGFAAMEAIVNTVSAVDTLILTCSSIAKLYPNDYFNGWCIYIVGGTGKNSYATVTDYVGLTGAFTVADWLSLDGSTGGTVPTANSIFYVTNGVKHPAGMQFDQAILAACLAQAELAFEDLKLGYMDKFLSHDLPMAWEIDARSAPLRLGMMLPGTRREGHERIWNDVTKR